LKTTKEIGICLLFLLTLSILGVQSAQGAKGATSAAWTFMVYMDADNNLDPYGPYSLGMMQEVGSTPNVNIVVLWDGFYKPAYMYKVIQGGIEEVKGFALNGKEANMGDPATLETFVDYALRKFPAEHNVLVLWDHGNDVSGICWDENPEDHLTHAEVVSALAGHHIDILATDACLMAMVEVAYEYNQHGLDIDYFIGSENYVPVAGIPYNTILTGLNQNPTMAESEAAQMIVHDFAAFYKPRAHFSGGVMATMSAIDISKMDDVVADLAVFTQALMVDMEDNHDMISEARGEGNLPWSEYGWDLYVDLPAFVECVTQTTADLTVKSAGEAVLSSLSEAIVALGNSEPMNSAGAQGMGIWFPASYHMMRGFADYQITEFAGQGWLDFLYAYWNDKHV
jgi:hypothetical protein